MKSFRFVKYVAGYSIPITAFLSLYFGGGFAFLTLIYSFGFIPLLELFFPANDKNMSAAEEEIIKKDKIYDVLLYINVPIQYFLIAYYLYTITYFENSIIELIGFVFALGICCGVLGINVAHELGHRVNRVDQFLCKSLLLTSLYMHFFIEHNKGHHKNVGTDADAASAKYGESIYRFWLRTLIFSFISAWNIEKQDLKKESKKVFSFSNEMVQLIFIQVGFIVLIAILFSINAMLLFCASAFIGMLLLETINYIEHYGLRRKKTDRSFERVQPWHSWNSNHIIGRYCLYELTRHSDHHYLASRKYQVLRNLETAPQLPTGYPGMMLLSLIPPLWFYVMHSRIHKIIKAN